MKLKTIALAALAVCATGFGAQGAQPQKRGHATTPEWIHNAVFYDIYPSSFMDSDGNGIGDIKGIISRLDYVKSLGVDAIWMNPIFESGFFDGGYDIIDYYKVDPRFGTLSDVRKLVDEVHKRGMKVCLDLVPGHSSNHAEWFRKAATEGPDGRYADYYIFTDVISAKDSADIKKRYESYDPDSSKLGPWVPTEEAHAGTPKDGKYTGNFYRKNYYPCQPALNFGYFKPTESWQQSMDAPGPKAVRRELKNIMAYWFDQGIDGFRVDMASSLVKGDDKHHTGTRRLWADIREWLDREYPGKALIAEWGNASEAINAGFDMDFPLMHKNPWYGDVMNGAKANKKVHDDAYFNKPGKGQIKRFVTDFGKHYDNIKGKGYISFFSANHDINRLNSEGRDTPDQNKVFMTFLLTMPGVPFIHYGDEIMMRNVKGLPSVEGSREERSGTRTPMQWDNTPSVGFSTAAPDKLYLPTFTDNGKLTVAAQENDPNSTLNNTRELIKLRHDHPALANDGDWKTVSDVENPYPWVYTRSTDTDTYYVVLNPSAKTVKATVDASAPLELIYSVGKPKAKVANGKVTFTMPGVTSAVYRMKK